MEDFLELEEFLELKDGEQLGDLDSSREVTMKDFLELEEWLEDMDQNLKKKLDDDQHTTRGDLETSPNTSIDRHQPDEIDQKPPHIIDQCPPYIIDRHSADSIYLHPPDIDRHRQPVTNRHHPLDIDRCPLLDEPPGCIVEMESIEEKMHEYEASHLVVPKHQRPLVWTGEAAGFHKRVKMIRDPLKIVVPCTVFEAEFPIPPDRSVRLASYINVFDDPLHAESSQRGLRYRGDIDHCPSVAVLKNTNQIPSIDTTTSSSIDTGCVSEQKEFDVCRNCFEGDTNRRSDKSGGKKRMNWKKRKMIKSDPQLSLITHFSDGVRKYIVRNRCFSQPYAKLRALLIAEMIDKGEEYMEEAFTKE
ncbi:uncharacterized protein LOC106371585 [Brassica napus]|uniref:uncharacterized protein LOC106371585 n=1 Tax=Brassica napus TaxID=3708 RepID=UPI002078F351|nr:uncharacterized protein LOC106371585 [Brassica napus]XP_048603513.1 uncharacterized protein LOC106371585 [Brassica napus]XP_048603514.1 uncharacterized protein LOC106371585 [Brassica napus]XP_048603515.1 uncharacterized protein LOC106371585 [Brassica napus]XP_048603516.1 uncharacterized protein LOC106371585 [Brassica napus]XP_048603517.1 uncharacterized protein LOC106371585 [Brassica napus]XP_048603518.1 uncharacterized protein LOC106371585 [Brassica napus]XP_048603519.1 uncharacterized p